MRPDRDGAEILVVEDDRPTRLVLARELAGAGLPGRRGRGRPHGARAVRRPPARPRPARPRAAGPRRPPGDPRDPPRGGDADPDPLGPLRGAREGRGARARRRRLRDQAVRDRRAAGADPAWPCATRRVRPATCRARWPSGRSGSTPAATRSTWATGPWSSRRASSRSCASSSPTQGRIVTKGRLLRAVWGEAYQGEDDYVYVHVSNVRRKLNAADSGDPRGCADRDGARGRLPGAARRRRASAEPSGIL